MNDEMPNCPTVTVCACGMEPCPCGLTERALRGWIAGQFQLKPMTPKQREWCYNEIDMVEAHDRKDYESGTDAELARGVLNAWMDYCRDKGLL